jgi:hypothetical protein
MMTLLIATFIGEARGQLSDAIWSPLAALLLLSGAATMYLLLSKPSRIDTSLIIARRKVDSPGFLRRNRDALAVGSLLAIVSYILGRLS